MKEVPSGSTDRYLQFIARDSGTGAKKTGITSWTVHVCRDNQNNVQHPSPVVQEVDATNRAGLYRYLCNLETTLSHGHKVEELAILLTAASTTDVDLEVLIKEFPGDQLNMATEKHQLDAYGYDMIHTVMDVDGITPLDISSYTGTKELALVRPEQGEELVTASFNSDGTDGKLKYTIASGKLDRTGPWRRNAKIQKSGVVYRDPVVTFIVDDVDPADAT